MEYFHDGTNWVNYGKNLEAFINDNIAQINKKLDMFSLKKLSTLNYVNEISYTSTDIATFLSEKMQTIINDKNKKSILDEELETIDGAKMEDIKIQLLGIANNNILLLKDIDEYYTNSIFELFYQLYTTNTDGYKTKIKNAILESENNLSLSKRKYINKNLSKLLDRFLYYVFTNGFAKNIKVSNPELTLANQGDSAQFLFLARAILAGFNCSNVDLRSSRYDAVIDYDSTILRIQVKGVSSDNLSFKDRDRGGGGNDPKAKTNKGKYLSSKDSDIIVAVDKTSGLCYLIPSTVIDQYIEDDKSSKSLSAFEDYKENWGIIKELCEKKAGNFWNRINSIKNTELLTILII